jgi:hypothetical protein
MKWQAGQGQGGGGLPSVCLTVDPALPALLPEVLRHLPPGFLPPVTAGDRPQRDHRIHMRPGPVHPSPFEPSLHDQFIGTLDAATPNGIAPRLIPAVIQHPPPLLQIVQTVLNDGSEATKVLAGCEFCKCPQPIVGYVAIQFASA